MPDVEAAGVLQTRISELVERFGTPRIASVLGVKSGGAVTRYKKGQRLLDPSQITALAQLSGWSSDYLLGLDETEKPEVIRYEVPVPDPPAAWEGFKRLPLQGWAGAGEPIKDLIERKDTRWYAFRDEFIYRVLGKGALWDPERMLVLKVAPRQESMRPTIRPGALVVVDRGAGGAGVDDLAKLRDGKVYVCQPGDEGVTVKRVTEADGGIILSSDNTERIQGKLRYPPRFLRLSDIQLQKVLIGRVVWIGQEEE